MHLTVRCASWKHEQLLHHDVHRSRQTACHPSQNQIQPPRQLVQVNKQDFLQVFQGSGIGKMEDN